MRRLLVPLALALFWPDLGCSTWSPSYQPRHTPDETSDHGALSVAVRAYPSALMGPGRVTYTLFLRGVLPECGTVAWVWPDGGVSSWSGCGFARADRKEHVLQCLGVCSTRVNVYDETGRSIASGVAAVQVGGDA